MKPYSLVFSSVIMLLLLINANYFNPTALAQRTTPRSNETQVIDESSSGTTSEGQNQDASGESSSTNSAASTGQITSKLGSSGDDLMSGTPDNDLMLGLQGADTIRGN
ncbi:MAG TPA: hypothetical protein VH878_08350, partial [Thermodesulfobacteriota bacterium]